MTRKISRRDFLKFTGGAMAAAAGLSVLPKWMGKVLDPVEIAHAQSPTDPPDLFWAGTDGWIYLPPTPPIGFFHPDNLAPDPFTTYIFGFRNITNMDPDPAIAKSMYLNQKNKAQHNAPLFWVNQYDPAHPVDFKMDLTNLGLALRPDLFDAHTIHWHGFRNVIPWYDGEPTTSVSVPTGRIFRYIYRPREAGTYMYHCHVEDVEHVHMGMTGLVFVRPLQDGQSHGGFTKFAYNDGDGSTGYNREYAMFLSEVWAEAHWADAHIQLPEWSDYRADFALLNGRVYPDTLAPNGSIDPFHPVRDSNGDLIAPSGHPELQYQPLSSLVNCNEGERVLLQFANLGFKESAMTLPGIQMRVIGRDATPMRGRDNTDTSYETDTISIGAGESFDVIFTAPPYQGPGAYDTYMLYNRSFARANNQAPGGYGGQATEVRVFPGGTIAAQTIPNT